VPAVTVDIQTLPSKHFLVPHRHQFLLKRFSLAPIVGLIKKFNNLPGRVFFALESIEVRLVSSDAADDKPIVEEASVSIIQP
jgi:hypothetical protein